MSSLPILPLHSCFCEAPITCTSTVDPVPVSSSVPIVQPAPPTTFASSPVANDNPPEPSAPLEEETFPNRSSDSTLPFSSHVPEVVNSPNCSLNTAVSSTSFPDDPFPEQHTVVPPSGSVFPTNTSTPTKTVTQRPLLTDALLNYASPRMTTLSLIRRADDFCPVYYAATPSIKGTPPLNTSSVNKSRSNSRMH